MADELLQSDYISLETYEGIATLSTDWTNLSVIMASGSIYFLLLVDAEGAGAHVH